MFWQVYIDLCNSVGKAPNVVAAEVGVKSSGTVTGWKNGALPRSNILRKLAEYFGVTIAELTGEEQKEKPPAQSGGLSERDIRLIKFFRSLPPEKLKAILISQDAPKELLD